MYCVCVFSPVLIPFLYFRLHITISTICGRHLLWCLLRPGAPDHGQSSPLCAGSGEEEVCWVRPLQLLRWDHGHSRWVESSGFNHQHNITRQVCVAKTTQSISPCLGFHDGLHNHQHDQTKVCDLFFRPWLLQTQSWIILAHNHNQMSKTNLKRLENKSRIFWLKGVACPLRLPHQRCRPDVLHWRLPRKRVL